MPTADFFGYKPSEEPIGKRWVSGLLALLKLISLSLAGFTSLLDGWIHIFVPEVQHFSVFPILTHSSTLNMSAAAWLQHDPNLQKIL